MKEMNIQKEIPEKVKKTVQNRDHRRCVVCGTPIFEYYPLKKFYTEKPSSSNVVLLCPKHFKEARKGSLNEEALEEARLNPFKPEKSRLGEYEIDFQSDVVQLKIGSNHMMRVFTKEKDSFAAIKYRNFPIVKLEKKKEGLTLTICMIDNKNNITLLIVDNEVVIATLNWTIEYQNNNLIIEDEDKEYKLQLVIDSTNNEIVLTQDSFFFKGKRMLNLPPSNPFEKPKTITRTKGDGIVIG